MNNLFVNIFRFILLLAIQIIIFNNMILFGFVIALPYILFILLFPVNGNKTELLLASFFMGLMMDFFSNSGGIHAAACLMLANFRPAIFKFAFGLSYEYQTIKINDSLTPERFVFIVLGVFLHHITLFLFEAFQVSFFLDLLVRALLSTVFTILSCILVIYIIKPVKR